MNKTRVKKGEKYWYISLDWGVLDEIESRGDDDKYRYDRGNYFPDMESGDAMLKKLYKVLNGADVIEMPSEEEWV